MKLRLVSRFLVLALVIVVGLIIIIHQHAASGAAPRVPRRTPTVGYTLSAEFDHGSVAGDRGKGGGGSSPASRLPVP